MSRVINSNSPTKIRNQNRRTIAEMLHHLVRKSEIDQESKDMVAAIVFALQEIHEGVDQSAQAWEKRGYWMKAERFLREWHWCGEMAANMDDVIRHEAWDLLPELLADLFPRFADIEIKSMTRTAVTWHGAHRRLLNQSPLPIL
jgi:hypothetical protein